MFGQVNAEEIRYNISIKMLCCIESKNNHKIQYRVNEIVMD